MAQPRQVTGGNPLVPSNIPQNAFQNYLLQQPSIGSPTGNSLSLAQTAAPQTNTLTGLPSGGNPLPGAPQAPTPGAGGTAPASTIAANPKGGSMNTGLISSIPQTFDSSFDGHIVPSPGKYPTGDLSGSFIASQKNYLDAIKGGRPWDPDPLPATQEDRLIWGFANNGRTPTAGQDYRGYFITNDGRGPNGEFGFFSDDSGVAPGLTAGTSYQGASGADLLAAMDKDAGLKALILEGLNDPKALADELGDEFSPLGQHFNRQAIFDAVELASTTQGPHPGERPDWWNNPMIYTPQHVMDENYRMANRDGSFTSLTREQYDAAVAALHRNGARGMTSSAPWPLGMNANNPNNERWGKGFPIDAANHMSGPGAAAWPDPLKGKKDKHPAHKSQSPDRYNNPTDYGTGKHSIPVASITPDTVFDLGENERGGGGGGGKGDKDKGGKDKHNNGVGNGNGGGRTGNRGNGGGQFDAEGSGRGGGGGKNANQARGYADYVTHGGGSSGGGGGGGGGGGNNNGGGGGGKGGGGNGGGGGGGGKGGGGNNNNNNNKNDNNKNGGRH